MALDEQTEADRFSAELQRWKVLRERELARISADCLWNSLAEPQPTMEVLREFFKKDL